MFRKILFATLIATASTFGASAATIGPRIIGDADGWSVVYDTPSANIVGSANATVGGSENDHEYMTQRVIATQRRSSLYGYGVNQNWTVRVESAS